MNAPPTAATPTIAVGRSARTASKQVGDRRMLVRERPLVLREAGASGTSRDPASRRASSAGARPPERAPAPPWPTPSGSAMPVAASPAPWNRIVCSPSRPPVTRSAEKMPASATAAVPWMSSLNVRMRSRYFSSSRNAWWLAKSSNWTTTPGKSSHARGHELLDQRVVVGAGQPRLLQAEVERVAAQLRIVGADVEQDRQAQVGMHARARRVERELAHRDAHAVRAEVAEAEDALAVGHHDDRDVAPRPVGEDLARRGRGRRALTKRPRGRWKMWPYCWQARPTVGV